MTTQQDTNREQIPSQEKQAQEQKRVDHQIRQLDFQAGQQRHLHLPNGLPTRVKR